MNNKELTELKKSRKMEVFYDGDDIIRIEMQGKTFIPTTVSVKMSEYVGVDNTQSNDEIKREVLKGFEDWVINRQTEDNYKSKMWYEYIEEYLTQKENNE